MNNNRRDDRLQAAFDAARSAAQQMPSAEQQTRARDQFLAEARTQTESVSPNGDVRHREQTGALSDLTSLEGEQRMNRFYNRRIRLIAAVLLGVIVAGGLWATPSLRVLAQEIFNFFTPASSDAVPTLVPLVAGPRPAQDANPYSLSLDEVAAQASFVYLPTVLPENYRVEGAEYQADRQTVYINLVCDDLWSLGIIEQLSDTAEPPYEVGASASIEDVPIRSAVGQYVRGAWEAQINEIGTAEPGADGPVVSVPRIWTAKTDWQHLVWREDGINFTLASGGSIGRIDARPACALDKDAFAAVAQGLQLAQ